MEVILRVTELRGNLQYAKAGISVAPVGDILYLVDVPESSYTEKEVEGEPVKVFNANGIRHILRGIHAALVVESDKEDF